MKETTRQIRLVVVVGLIIGAIIWLNGLKSKSSATAGSSAPVVAATTNPLRQSVVAAKAAKYPMAPELEDPSGFINTSPFKLSDLIGKKVILVDFWTYSCINCQRTIPYLNAWYAKYKDEGLVIVGVHSPEFQFEHDITNVQAAVKKFGIQYPVVLDNDMGTWSAYHNLYWPAEYLIDIDGFVVHTSIGEGDYDATEKAIQAALQERATVLNTAPVVATGTTTPTNAISFDANEVASPETYFGSARNDYLGNGSVHTAGVQNFPDSPASLQSNTLYLTGTWNITDEYATNESAATITYQYSAKNVYMVAGSTDGVSVKVLLDGKPISVGAGAGADVAPDGTMTVKDNRLYSIIQNANYGEHTLQLQVDKPGLQAFTFTFG